jgi:hypothetical protein
MVFVLVVCVSMLLRRTGAAAEIGAAGSGSRW